METLRRVPDSLANRPPYDFYAAHLADIGEFEFAFEAASRLPYPQPRLDYLRHLAQRQAEAGDIDAAWKSFWAMLPGDVTSIQDVERHFADRPEGLPVNIFVALGAIAAAEVRAGDLDSALMLERLPHKAWSAPFQGIAAQIAGALAETGKVDEALTMATAIESIVERQNAFEMIFDVLAENSEWKRAKEVAPMIDAHARSFEAVLRLAELQAENGDLPGAISTYDTVMKGSTLFFRHLAEKQLEATRLAIAGALIHRGDRDTAEHYYDQVLMGLPWRNIDRQVRPLFSYREILDLVGRVATARYKAGDAEGAAALVDEAVAFSDRDRMAKSQQEDVVGRLVSIQCQTGLFTAALKTAATAKSQSGRIDALSCTLRGVLTGQ
jgi:tetratricopeptide (TPR) repeat protein